MELSQIRKEIDRVDRQIRTLFQERMDLADQVARVKAQTGDDVYKPDREEEIIAGRSQGMDPSILPEYQALIKKIMGLSRAYQYGRILEMGGDFPFSCRKTTPEIQRLAVSQEDADLSLHNLRDTDFLILDQPEQVGETVAKGETDAGLVIVDPEDIPRANRVFAILMDQAIFVTDCRILKMGEKIRKVFTFSREGVVLPDHNRILTSFRCPDPEKDPTGAAGVLSMVADYGFPLTALYTRPLYQEGTISYDYFAELSACMDQAQSRALLLQLSKEAKDFHFLGSYAVHCPHS